MRMLIVATVVMMHEQVHQRACEQQQVGQYPQHVCAVLGKHKETGNGEKPIEHPTASG